MRKLITVLFLGIVAVATLYVALRHSTTSQRPLPNIAQIKVELTIERLEQTLFSLHDKEAIRTFLKDNPTFTTQFLGVTTANIEEKLVERLYAMIKDPNIQPLYQEVQRVFGDCSAIRQQLTTAFRHLKYYYPDFKVPQIATFITGMGTDLYVSEDLIVIGLDFFIGEGAKFRPIRLPEYLLRGYQPAHIVPKTVLLLSQQFIKTHDSDSTLLADMLYYGKAYYFAQALLPQVEASTLLDYTPEQLAEVEQHQDIIWEHFIERKLLYNTNHLIKNKYLSNRPFVAEIGPRCPGHIGRWLGWEIIKKYMKQHTEVSLPILMNEPDTQKLFTQSKYRPRK
ncbi:MAG: gliding motility lipoprotein GldB [Bacteroidota bacterium]